MNTLRQMGVNEGNANKNMEKLSSGQRINRAGDDAAGLAISEKMRGQIRGLDMASKNSQDGISLIQTAEGALNESQAILQRMRELAVQSANDTNTTNDRNAMQAETSQLFDEVNRIASQTQFNTKALIKSGITLKFQVGANSGQTITVSINKMDASTLLGVNKAGMGISTQANANKAIANINSAINKVSLQRANLGAYQNRLEHTINNLNTSSENLSAAESRIRDVDMAKEMSEFTKNNILSQAAQSMLAQANQQPQGVLQLLR
jgi:flagellin